VTDQYGATGHLNPDGTLNSLLARVSATLESEADAAVENEATGLWF